MLAFDKPLLSTAKLGDNVLGSICLSVNALTAEPFDLDIWHGGHPLLG